MIARALVAAFVLIGVLAASADVEDRQIAKRRAAERKTFTNAEIFKGFFKTAFGAELGLAGNTDRIRKYDVPIRVFVENSAKPDRRQQVAAVVADIKSKIADLDIEMAADAASANVTVRLLRQQDFMPALRKAYGAKTARRIARKLQPQCISGFRKDAEYRIEHSDVFLVADRSNFIFLDCAYEELLQSLGPINDTDEVPWTMFNDRVQMGFFGVYDQYILNILYHPRVRAGMTAAEVRALLPQIMPEVRTFVAKTNGLKE